MFSIFIVHLENHIVIHTASGILDYNEQEKRHYGILFKHNNCYLVERKRHNLISRISFDVSSQLFIRDSFKFGRFCLDTSQTRSHL